MMFSATISEENRAPSWNCTPVRACMSRSALPCRLAGIDAQHLDGPLGRVVEADDGAQQHGFAGTRTADQADNLAAEYVEIEIVVDDVVAELRAHAAQLEHDVAAVAVVDQLAAFRLGRRLLGRSALPRLRHHTSASRKMIENTASRTMTQKIDSTTERVVSWPTLSALPLDLQSLEAADGGDHRSRTPAP